MHLDLNSLRSVEEFSEAFLRRFGRLDILVNNAGLNTSGTSADGFDKLFAVNFLGHFRLTQNLLPLMRARHQHERGMNQREREGRIINLSSVMHHFGHSDWEICLDAKKNSFGQAYSPSKLAMCFFTRALNRSMLVEKGHGIRAFSVNPGAVRSDIWRSVPMIVAPIYDAFMRVAYLDVSQGCVPSVAAACEDFPEGVEYLQPYFSPSGAPLFFEIIGPYVGYAPMIPTLPPDADEEAQRLVATCKRAIESAIDFKE